LDEMTFDLDIWQAFWFNFDPSISKVKVEVMMWVVKSESEAGKTSYSIMFSFRRSLKTHLFGN